MSDEAKAGQEGPTPDFIPGWWVPREGNPDPATREAVKIPADGDFFPIIFLRSNERVAPCQRPRLGFVIGTTSQPGHDRFDLSVPPGYWIVRDADGKLYNWRDEDFKAKYLRLERKWTAPVERDVPSGEPAAAERTLEKAARVFDQAAADEAEARAPRTPSVLRDNPHLPEGAAEKLMAELAEGVGWKGEEPAEGTRRHLIREAAWRAIKGWDLQREQGAGYAGATGTDALAIADAVESALLKSTIDEEARASVERLDVSAEESNSRGGRELRVVLRRDDDDHSNLLFVEIDNEKGTSVGGFERREVDGLVHIVIPVPYPVGPVGVKCARGGTHAWPRNPYRDGRSCLKCGTFPEEAGFSFRDDAWVTEVVYQAAGAATRPLLEDHPDYVFPAERVRDAVAYLLETFGVPQACYGCQEEQLEHGRAEAMDAPGEDRGDDAPTQSDTVPDEFSCATVACERLMERLEEGPVPNAAELARVIDILRHGNGAAYRLSPAMAEALGGIEDRLSEIRDGVRD